MMSSEQNVSEEILLSSNDEYDRQPDPEQFKHITAQLMQDSKRKMQRKLFRIHNGKFLSVKEHTLTSKKTYWFPLAHLDPEPEHHKSINWWLVLSAVITCQVAILIVYLRFSMDLGRWAAYTTAPATILFIASLILLVMTIYTYTNHFIYASRKGRYPIAVVLNNLPSKQACQEFIATLNASISQARQSAQRDESQQLAAELRELRRLRDEAAISNEDYARAKRNIFSNY